MTQRRGRILSGLMVAMALLAPRAVAAPPAGDDANQPGITVVGTGQAKGMPVLVEISATVTGEADLTADAIVKYRDARKQAVEALEGLKIDGLVIESDGFSISQAQDEAAIMAARRGMPAPADNQRVSVSEQLRLRLTEIQEMEPEVLMDSVLKVIDTGRDAGLQVGPGPVNVNYYPPPPAPPLVAFKMPDSASVRTAAYEIAMKDAREKAEKLAELAGVRLGEIASVSEGDITRQNQSVNIRYYATQEVEQDPVELSGSMFGPLAVTLRLTVTFQIAGPAQVAAQQ